MDLNTYYDESEFEMAAVIEHFENNLVKISTGSPNPKIFENVLVNYFGEYMPLTQLSTIGHDLNQFIIKPFDKSSIKEIISAINSANLKFNPINEGDKIRIEIPHLSEQTRKDKIKQSAQYVEEAKIKIRNIRQRTNKTIKSDKNLSKDQVHDFLEEIQNLTDTYVKRIDAIGSLKAKELTTF